MVIIAVLASAMVAMFVLHTETDSSSAELTASGECGDGVYYTLNDGTLEIFGSGAMYDFNETYAPWHEFSASITKIVIGDRITSLGGWAFVNCLNLKNLTIPITLNSVKNDTYPAFAGCFSIEKVHFTCGTNGYAYNYAAYGGSNNFYQNTPWYQSRDTLTEIEFADGIKSIGADCFRELSITAVCLPETVVCLGCHCFYKCTLLTNLTIPVSLNSFGNEDYPAFEGCMAIEYITFTEGNGTPYDYKHWWGSPCDTELAPWNMNNNIGKKVTITEKVTSLGRYMFYGCNIEELTLPINFNAVKDDSDPAFEGMHGLVKVTFTIGSGNGVDYAAYKGYDRWYQQTPWYMCRSTVKEVVFQDGIIHIGADAFRELNITSLVIPDSVESLGCHSFYRCGQLADLTIPITLDSMYPKAYPAFEQCYAIATIHLTAGTNGIGCDYSDHIPIWSTPLHRVCKIIIDADITYIGTNTFEGFAFIGSNGSVLRQTAEDLCGHTFYGANGILYQTEEKPIDSVDCRIVDHTLVGDTRFVDGRYMELNSLCDEIPAIPLDPNVTPVSAGNRC